MTISRASRCTSLRKTRRRTRMVCTPTARASTFPNRPSNATNYWVDVIFTTQTFTTPPGQVGNIKATAGYASASRDLVGSDDG